VERLVFVCKGNICRSAYAEAVARSLGVEAVSCGLDAIDGAPADEMAASAAQHRGFSLDDHNSTSVSHLELRETDLLVAMEPWQSDYLKVNHFGRHQRTLLGLWSRPVLPHLQDPFGSSPEYFDKCFENIEKSVNEIAKKISKPGG
jgi:protein-tyrosine phosphatase